MIFAPAAHQPSGGIRILDDRRIEFRLTKPYATFLKILASPTAYVVPREAVKFYGTDFAKHPVGTGPFRLARWKPLEQIILVRNDHYWRSDMRGAKLPYLDSIDIRYQADAAESVMVAAFLKEETYLLAAQEKLYRTLKEDLLKPDKYQMVGLLPSASLRFLGFSLETASPLARHSDLRRALAMAFDRQQLVKQAPQVNTILADTLVPPIFLNRSLPWYPYDLKGARDIVDTHRMELEESPPILASNYQSDDVDVAPGVPHARIRQIHRAYPAGKLLPVHCDRSADHLPREFYAELFRSGGLLLSFLFQEFTGCKSYRLSESRI